ncbi:hypothetical protein [Streptomyces sp. NPDC088794]|uniref:hypothetical protein n=1 Tax=Streptomyces sp. NPDC088794 TaxID=3365902 RepID=UPI003810D8F3
MTQHTAHATLAEEIARAVEAVPGVAFLRPGLTSRLRAALSRTNGSTRSAPPSGVRVSRPDGAEFWRVEIHLVALRHARSVDVARAVRGTVEERVARLFPADPTSAQVTVIVTGLV